MYLLTGWRWPDSSSGWCEGSSSKEKASSSNAMVMSSSGYGRTAKANEDVGCNPSWWREESWQDDEGDKAENQIFFAPQAWSLAPGLPAHICMNSSLDSFNLSARGNQPTRLILLLSLPTKQGSSKPSALSKHGAGGCSRSHIPIGSNVLQKFLASLEKA